MPKLFFLGEVDEYFSQYHGLAQKLRYICVFVLLLPQCHLYIQYSLVEIYDIEV